MEYIYGSTHGQLCTPHQSLYAGPGAGGSAINDDLADVDALMLDIADQYMIASNKMSQISALSAGYALDISSKLDVDFAGETTELAKGQILAQAGTAMLAQANAQGQGMLALIQS